MFQKDLLFWFSSPVAKVLPQEQVDFELLLAVLNLIMQDSFSDISILVAAFGGIQLQNYSDRGETSVMDVAEDVHSKNVFKNRWM